MQQVAVPRSSWDRSYKLSDTLRLSIIYYQRNIADRAVDSLSPI
jgi:hypothetical protein